METLYEWFIEKPQRLTNIGHALSTAGLALLLVGVRGHMIMTATTIMIRPAITAEESTAKTLAEIYPTLPTWWIPESFAGFAFAVGLIIMGTTTAMAGKKLKRLLA